MRSATRPPPSRGVRLARCLSLLASVAGAQSIKLSDGTIVRGRATAYDDVKKLLSFRTDDGQDKTYTLDQLDQRSVYMVNTSLVPETSGKGQLQLANYARDIGLYAHAARRYGLAEKADPSLKPEIDKERVILRKEAAVWCMNNANAAKAKGDTQEVERWLTILVQKLPNEPQAAEAATMLEQTYTQQRNARDDELEREHAELIQGDAKQAKMLYDRMIKRAQEGLTARSSQSEGLWNGSIADGKAVLKDIDRLQKKYASDPKVQDGAAKYRALTISQMIDVYMNLSSMYSVRTSFDQALRAANSALALDPGNETALAQRARVEAASSQSGLNIF